MALMTKAEAAAELAVTPKTLDNWRWRGKGPAFVKMHGEIRYAPEAIRKFITDSMQQPAVEAFMEEWRRPRAGQPKQVSRR